MNNYQILEFVLEGLFFATVAAVAVIFTIIRERSIRKSLSTETQKKSPSFSSIMDRAAAAMPSPEDLLSPSHGTRDRVMERLGKPPVSATRHKSRTNVKITRAERELIASLAEDGSRQGA